MKVPSIREGALHSLFLASCIFVGGLLSHSRRPQLIHRRCSQLKRPKISPEDDLLQVGHGGVMGVAAGVEGKGHPHTWSKILGGRPLEIMIFKQIFLSA